MTEEMVLSFNFPKSCGRKWKRVTSRMQCDTYYTIDIYGMVGKNMEGSLSEEYSLGVLPREF